MQQSRTTLQLATTEAGVAMPKPVMPGVGAVQQASESEPALDDSLVERAAVLAASHIQDMRRVDMQRMSAELGVSRVTLFRHVGSRDVLIGRALWHLTALTLAAAERHHDGGSQTRYRTVGVIHHFNALVCSAPGLRDLLDREPAVALRVLTDLHRVGVSLGAVQPGVVAAIEALLRQDVERGLVLLIEPNALSFALVRLGESFLYADALASRTPDLRHANRLQQALIEGSAPSP